MALRQKSICLISSGINDANLRLQPWRYLHEVARQLGKQGHPVTIITDGTNGGAVEEYIDGVVVQRISTVSRQRWRANLGLQAAIEQIQPEAILWHVGLPSFVHQRFDNWPNVPVVGIFPALIYKPGELIRLGLRRLVKGYRLSAMHVLGTMVPRHFLRQPVQHGLLHSLVVQTETTCRRLTEAALPPEKVQVIAPGVDDIWDAARLNFKDATRTTLGYTSSEVVVLYFGSPAPLRGLHTLIRAVELARETGTTLELMVLSRRRSDELLREDAELRQLLSQSDLRTDVKIVSGFLEPPELVRHIAASDIIALPFELVPADAPLSVLEAQALGKPIVTTRVGCLPELAGPGQHYLAQPANPVSLAEALQQAVNDLQVSRITDQSRGGEVTNQVPVRRWCRVGEEWSHLIQNL